MPKPVLSPNPTVAKAASAWTSRFAAAVRAAAGDTERLTPKKAAEMTGPYADNAKNFFDKTGKRWASADTVVESGANYVRAKLAAAAGPDGKLSLADIRSLPADLSGDLLALRGKTPALPAPSMATLQAALRGMDVSELTDYGKSIGIVESPASASRADVLRGLIGYDDLSDAEASEWFDSTKGAGAAAAFASSLREVGAEVHANADEDPGTMSGADLEGRFTAVADAAEGLFKGAGLKNVEFITHYIAEDGDLEHRALIAQKSDDYWMVLSYTDFPF